MGRSLLIFALCLIPRLLYLVAARKTEAPGENSYWILSENLLYRGTLSFGAAPTTDYEPLYPAFLAFSRWIAQDRFWLVMTFQSIAASLAAVWLYRLTFRLSKSNRTQGLAAALYSFYPYYIRQSSALIEVGLFTAFLILCVLFYLKADELKYSLAAGVAFGLTLLLRTTATPFGLQEWRPWF